MNCQALMFSINKRINSYIQPVGVYARTSAAVGIEFVADGVLDPECDEIQAFERTVLGADLDLDRVAGREPIAPGKAVGGLVNIVFGPIWAVKDSQQHAAGDPAF